MIRVKECKACGIEFKASGKGNRVYCDFCARQRHTPEAVGRVRVGAGNLTRISNGCEKASYSEKLRFGFALMGGIPDPYEDTNYE